MTALLERAVARIRDLPPATQDALAELLLSVAGDEGSVHPITPEEEASLATSLSQSERGEFATEAAVEAIWAKHAR